MSAGEVAGPVLRTDEPQAAAAEPRLGWLPGPRLQGLLALLIYLGVFVVAFGLPLVRHLGVPEMDQGTVDANFYIWSWRWWPYAIAHGLNPLYSHEIGAPAGYNLAWATTTPAAALAVAPVTLLFGPIVSFNLTLLVSAPACGWAAFVAARRLTGRFWAALLGGAVYGFCAYEESHSAAGQANLIVNMLPPLMVYLALVWRDGKLRRLPFIGLLAIGMALEFYVFLEAFVQMTVLWVAALAIGFAVATPEARRAVARLARLAGIAYAVALVLASPYLIYAFRHYPASSLTRYSEKYSLDLVDLAMPRPNRLFFLTSLTHYAQSVSGFSSAAYVGVPLLLIVLLAAIRTWSSRLTRLLIMLFLLVLLIAIGPRLLINNKVVFTLPWAKLWQLPIVHSAEPVRFVLVGFFVLAMLLAAWLARPATGQLALASRWALAVLAVAFILADSVTFRSVIIQPVRVAPTVLRHTSTLPTFLTSDLYRHYLRPGETVVVVSERQNAGMLFQADANFYMRIAGGFINESLSDATGLPPAVVNLQQPTKAHEDQFRTYVRQAGVGAIIVERAWSARWMHVFAKMGLPATKVGGVIIYKT